MRTRGLTDFVGIYGRSGLNTFLSSTPDTDPLDERFYRFPPWTQRQWRFNQPLIVPAHQEKGVALPERLDDICYLMGTSWTSSQGVIVAKGSHLVL